MKLFDVIEELVEERGLSRSELSDIVSEGLLAAYTKRYPDLPVEVSYDKKTDDMQILIAKKVVAQTPEDEDLEVSLRKARAINPNINVDDTIKLPFDGKIGRIEILRAKQVIAQKIRSVEALAVYNEFKSKEGTIVHGVIHKCERSGVVVKLQDTLAFLPKSYLMPSDKCIVGYSIRALLKEVLAEPRSDNQLILDRVSEDFLKKLFELEIPEVYERLVEIKAIVRNPGYKSKVVVTSHDKNIDPVGTCVGLGGARIKPILKELDGEKVDIIAWVDSREQFIKDSLKPAVVNRVVIVDSKNAQVYVDEDQRSLAIGRMGQNISLASRLVGLDLHLVQEESRAVAQEEFEELD